MNTFDFRRQSLSQSNQPLGRRIDEQERRIKDIVDQQLIVQNHRLDNLTHSISELTSLVDFLKEHIDAVHSRRGSGDFEHATALQVEEIFKRSISVEAMDRMLANSPNLSFLR